MGAPVRKSLVLALLVILTINFSACAKKPPSKTEEVQKSEEKVSIWHFKKWLRKRRAKPERSAPQIYNDAMRYFTRRGKQLPFFKKGHYLSNPDYTKAREYFEDVLYQHPLSKYAPLARLHIADCYYEQGKYDEAIASYEEFRRIHITREEIPFVIYRIGMSYYHQMYSLDRDQTYTKLSLREFMLLEKKYPESPYTMAVGDKIEILRKRLADHEMYVARFYFRHNEYWSSADRLIGALKLYMDTGIEEEARFYLGRNYLLLEKPALAKAQFEGIEKKYPKGKFTRRYRYYIKFAEKHPALMKLSRQRGYIFP